MGRAAVGGPPGGYADFFCWPMAAATPADGLPPVTVTTHRTYRSVRTNPTAWAVFEVVVLVNVAPVMSVQPVLPSADSCTLPPTVVPPATVPVSSTANPLPSAEIMSIADPFCELVATCGGTLAPSSACV